MSIKKLEVNDVIEKYVSLAEPDHHTRIVKITKLRDDGMIEGKYIDFVSSSRPTFPKEYVKKYLYNYDGKIKIDKQQKIIEGLNEYHHFRNWKWYEHLEIFMTDYYLNKKVKEPELEISMRCNSLKIDECDYDAELIIEIIQYFKEYTKGNGCR